MDRFVTGFLGRRDGYQLPLALAEAGLMSRFITGAYDVGMMASLGQSLGPQWQATLAKRCCHGIPENLVSARWDIELLQHLSRLIGDRSNRSWTWANVALSKALRDEVRRAGGHLITYEPYAWEALTATYDHPLKKVLFHFHLHPRFERALLDADVAEHPLKHGEWIRQDALPQDDGRIVDAWKHADHVICASSFTRSSLVADGMSLHKCSVIPYGIDLPPSVGDKKEAEHFSVLFVGSGLQRKGLHHLLVAWSQARLPAEANLTLVCRSLDPALEPMLAAAPSNVRLLRGVSAGRLNQLLAESALFVMPSLIEGFGQVYLEALAAGCPVLGTSNSCLPDLGAEADGIFLTPAGDTVALRRRLESLPDLVLGARGLDLRERASSLARCYSWARFRDQMQRVLLSLLS